MKALLLIAHGSRSAAANAEIGALAEALRAQAGFDAVQHAFLEMAQPDILAGGNALAAAGATEITALPYFLAAGRHVAEDVPAELAALQAQHPAIKLTLAAHLGAAAGMLPLIHAHLRETSP